MKKLLVLILLTISSSFLIPQHCEAQYVTILDANFVKYLKTVVPTAMVGNTMDTTNNAVLSLAYIRIEAKGIKDITGVQYFKSLITLDCGNGYLMPDSNHIKFIPIPIPATLDTLICGNNRIDTMPTLPSNLIYLACYENKLTFLPTLPSTLTTLDCSYNQITGLPALPASLQYLNCYANVIPLIPALPANLLQLDCGYNLLPSLPALPASLNTLECDGNQIPALPALPNSLIYLSCSNNLLPSLPILPPSLISLNCGSNQIPTLPALPSTLQSLMCWSNMLTNLPALPTTLTYLYCSNNLLTSLPSLPANLQTIFCSSNKLTALPALPVSNSILDCSLNPLTALPALPAGMTNLYCENDTLLSLPTLPSDLQLLFCYNNYITCFPVFPNSLVDTLFNISNNPFNCLPNYIRAMDKTTLLYPLCLPGNSNGCPVTPGVFGFTYYDADSSCVKDTGHNAMVNIPVQIYNTANTLLGQTYTALNGVYSFPEPAGNYRVHIDTTGMPYDAQCPFPGIDSNVSFALLDTNVNFSLTCKSGFDVGVQSVVTNGLIFPGVQHALSVVAGDMSQWYNLSCAKGDSGTVQINVSGPVTYIGPGAGALTPNVVSGNNFTYHIADYGALNNTTAFNLILQTDTLAQGGDTICMSVTVTPLADNNPSNNTFQYCYYVINSHDPNNKTVYPVDVVPGYDGWFTYTIHFQNMGSAMAKNITIKDNIDDNLNINTFQLTNYSFRNTTTISGRTLTARFEGINLPDSSTSPSGSAGFIQYHIKPKAGLSNGTVIRNTGDIYFDFNAAIITNTTENTFTQAASTGNTTSNYTNSTAYPNPNKGAFTITLQNIVGASSISIFNVLEQEVYHASLTTGNAQVSLLDKSPGMYFYSITTANGTVVSRGKIIVE